MDLTYRLRNIMSEWLKLISQHLHVQTEKVPSGWKTMSQIAQEMNRDSSTANRLLKKMREKNLIETQTFYVKSGERTIPIPHYKLKSRKS